MQISNFTPNDIHPFLSMAKDEGWISTRRELAFLLERSPQGCLVCHDGEKPVGFVTAVRHGKSGWIGNLLVAAGERGRGIGTALFKQAMQVLQRADVLTLWLTASSAGRPIYERNGFTVCDRIRRWEGLGGEPEPAAAVKKMHSGWEEIDFLGWGDDRTALLAHAADGGSVRGSEGGFLVVQSLGNHRQIGPYGALNLPTAEALMDGIQQQGGATMLDVPAANRAASKLLTSRGFTVCSEVDLMYAGQPPGLSPGVYLRAGQYGEYGLSKGA
jgi:Acetyltransferase (GNAT) family.